MVCGSGRFAQFGSSTARTARSENTRSRMSPLDAADILRRDDGTAHDAAGIGGDGQQHLHLVEVEHAWIGAPAAPDVVADGAALRHR